MAEVLLSKSATLKEAEDMIVALGGNGTVHLMGEMGVGKTSMFKNIVARTGYRGVYIDGPNIELGELGVPIPDHSTKTTRIYPNEMWGFHLDEPLVVFIDEIHRLNPVVEEVLYPAMEDRALDIMIGEGPSARSVRWSAFGTALTTPCCPRCATRTTRACSVRRSRSRSTSWVTPSPASVTAARWMSPPLSLLASAQLWTPSPSPPLVGVS